MRKRVTEKDRKRENIKDAASYVYKQIHYHTLKALLDGKTMLSLSPSPLSLSLSPCDKQRANPPRLKLTCPDYK